MAGLSAGLPRVAGPDWTGVNCFCTTRGGGVSAQRYASLNLGLHAGDDAARVLENRRRLDATLPQSPLWLNQVHGIQVCDADACTDNGGVPTADAAVTIRKNRVLAVMTADCLPVVMADMAGCALGVAHAGWRGLLNGVLEQTLACLRARRPGPAAWRAWIGPGIGPRHFEVGADVFLAFTRQDSSTRVFFAEKNAGSKWLADLPGLARHRLRRAGVDSIELSGYCTFDREDLFYSYRRDPRTGRMATLAWLGD